MLLEVLIKLRDIFGGRVSVVVRVWLLEKLKTEVLIRRRDMNCTVIG